jgi:hypothetical protein
MNKEQFAKFEAWLLEHGCEILPATNDYEVLRWKGRETGVLYNTGKTNAPYAARAIVAFISNNKWNGGPQSTGRDNSYKKQKLALLKRDGHACFFCGTLLGDDITLEHLIPLTAGGPNILANMVLAHGACNQAAGVRPIYEKVMFAVKTRVDKFRQTHKKND